MNHDSVKHLNIKQKESKYRTFSYNLSVANCYIFGPDLVSRLYTPLFFISLLSYRVPVIIFNFYCSVVGKHVVQTVLWAFLMNASKLRL